MPISFMIVLASFLLPENIGATPASLLWLFPLAASIAVAYKATKVPEIKLKSFVKESVILFGSILVFMFVTAMVLFAVNWLAT
jgi:hypothetical protein